MGFPHGIVCRVCAYSVPVAVLGALSLIISFNSPTTFNMLIISILEMIDGDLGRLSDLFKDTESGF